MTAFSPTRNFNRLSPFERMSRAYETPMGFGQVMGDQLKQGILDSYGLGTAIRELSLPPLLNDAPQRGDTPENFATRQRVFEEKALDEEAYKASPYFRKEVPWERGMTEDRAAALAGMWDQKMIRGHFAEKQPIAAFMGQLFGQAFDPINYIPVFGPGMRTAAVAKAGSIGGRMAIAASEAAINTAAFSVLTSGIRDRFGDDTSFNSIMLEIATSALIGGAFGAGAGVLMRGQDARVRREVRKAVESLQTIATKQEAVALLNDATHGLATKGMPDISATAGQIVSNTAEKLEARSAGARALVNETALIAAPDEPGRVVISPQGSRVEVQPEVVDISALTHASGSLQVRDRTRFDSQKWVEETATTLNPALLMPDISSDRGAPLVGDDNIIDSGNGRVMALRRVYDAYPEKAAEYRSALEKAGYDLTGIERPVLISRRTTPLSPEARAQFNAESNARTSAAMSATEIAQMDADAMSDDVLAKATDAPITAASNRPFVRAFLANIPATEHGALIDAQGNLSAAGAARLQNAVVAAAYADADPAIMRRFTEATDDNSRTILAAMSDVAGVWARMRREITRGNIDPAFDPTPSITEAVRLLNGWRAQAQRESRPIGTVIKEGMAQIDLLAGGLRPDVNAMLRALYTDDSFSRAVGRERLTNLLSTMVTKVTDLGAPSLLERPNVPLERIIASAQADGSPDLFAPASALGFPEGGGGEGRGAEVPPSGQGRGQGSEGSGAKAPPAKVVAELRDVLDAADERLGGDAAKAIDEFVGHGPKSRDKNEFEAMGIMRAHRLEAIARGDAPEEARALEAAFAPIREEIRKRTGNTVTLYRVQGEIFSTASTPADGLRAALSWTADPKFAEAYAGVKKKMKVFSEEEIKAFEKTFEEEGKVRIGNGNWLVKEPDSKYPGIFPDRNGEPAMDDMVTDTDSVRAYIESDNGWALEFNAKQDEKARSIVKAEVSLDDVMWITDRAGQAEFIVRNRAGSPAFINAKGKHSGATLTRLSELANDEQALQRNLFIKTAPKRTLDETFAAIPVHQKALGELGDELAKKHGVKFLNPGLKKKATAEQKMQRKRYDDTRRLTDLVRAGFVVDTPQQADAILAELAGRWKVIDEGWYVTEAGYFDSKALIQFEDGSIGEVQFWHPDMLNAKDAGGGHKLYEAMRGLSPDDPKFIRLQEQQRVLYGAALDKVGPEWRPIIAQLMASDGKGGASGNLSSNASSEILRPLSNTSAASTFSQSPASTTTANAADLVTMAGRPSQSKNLISMLDNVGAAARDLKLVQPKDDPVPEGLVEAEARVGKPETLDETAEHYGVDSETGEFDELGDIDQIEVEGRLTPEDKTALKAAEEDFKLADAYGKALDAAVRCVI